MQRIMGRLHLLMEGGGEGIYIVVTHKEATTNTRERVKGRPDWNREKERDCQETADKKKKIIATWYFVQFSTFKF